MSAREALKAAARGLATVAVVPALISFRIRSAVMGRTRAIEGSTQALALVPGLTGQYLRRAFLCRALAHCHTTATIEFGTIFSSAESSIEENVYVGPRCHLGFVHLERDVLIGAGVHIPSGPATHGISDASTPIREQEGTKRQVRVAAGSWIGSGAIVMADVGRDTVVGAGSVVTNALPDSVVAAGVPARILRSRQGEVQSA